MKFDSLLWKFYKNDAEACHYIFGTMHLGSEAAYTYAEKAKIYIRKSSLYAAEMDLNESVSKDLTPYFKLQNGALFSELFKPKRYDKILRVVKKEFGIDLTLFDEFTPFFITNMLAESAIHRKHEEALDHFLWYFAMEDGKDLRGVETFEDQVHILKQIPLDYQLKAFKDVVGNLSAFNKKLKHLNEMYERADLKNLYRSSKKSMGSLRKLMIYDRNVHMTTRIISLSEEKPAFFALGAAHLPGDKGILAILQKKGYMVKAIN
ncbi:MAG: TraB/GumN family protein [Saprospiraceae bacterium]|nr:TraB/GumN family protein [Saprospiraceae bacterium]